jgi:hypothetical protein
MRLICWRSGLVAVVVTAVAGGVTVGLPGAAAARPTVRGGSGVVSTWGVAAQRFESANRTDIRAFAGKPNSVVYLNKDGERTGSHNAVWESWTYTYADGGYVDYSFHRSTAGWRFTQFGTNRKQFRTARGVRVGMTYAEAKKREGGSYIHGCLDSGFWRFRDGTRFAVIVGVNPGQLVHALIAYGPGATPC